MDFRIQNKSTGTPTPLISYNNHQHHNSPTKHNSHQEKQLNLSSIPQNQAEVSSFTPSPTIDHAPNQRPKRDSDNPDPTHIQLVETAQPPTNTSIRYRECLKNHAAHLGSHVVDGCGEFMPDGDGDEPSAALRCAACGCHRNFHRKETAGTHHHSILSLTNYKHHQSSAAHPTAKSPPAVVTTTTTAYKSAAQFHNPSPLQQTPMSSVGKHHAILSHHFPPPTMMTFGDQYNRHGSSSGGAATESSSEDLNLSAPEYGRCGFSSSKKRFRTKFTQEQKDRMMEFAQKIEWRIQKPDEVEVQQFCAEVGVKRKVFKVWMHNNKQAMKRRESC